ncbi:MAG: protein phosphatase CheZ [Methylocystaceae bacterium]|nr:protein phosphatase CheZ [Methylocystaceae bacterium]
MSQHGNMEILAEQIRHLVLYITKIKSELAAIKHPKSSVDHFNTVAEQLNTICETTEDATNTIMESAEGILTAVDELSANVKYDEAQQSCNTIMDSTNKIFESCSFHDLTGQRISKIVRIMNRLEGTLDSLVKIVGPKGLEEMPIDSDETIEDVIGMKDGDIAMHGPQTMNEAVSQDDIDALFGSPSTPPAQEQVSQDDIDSMFDSPAPAAPAKEEPAASATVSQDAIDSMFDNPAESAPEAKKEEKPKEKVELPAGGEASQDDIDKLFG